MVRYMCDIDGHDGVERRYVLDAPLSGAHIDIERQPHIVQPFEGDPGGGAGAGSGVWIIRLPREIGHRFRKRHGMLASPASDLQDFAMCRKHALQDRKLWQSAAGVWNRIGCLMIEPVWSCNCLNILLADYRNPDTG